MAKKYNILNDKDSIRNILEMLDDLCCTMAYCRFCPFGEDGKCLVEANGRIPKEYFVGDDD